MSFDPEHHHRRSIRLQSYDYRQTGAYFVTVCTHGREPHFGNVTQGIMHLSALGECVLRHWYDIPRSFVLVELDAFVVMPNHIHGIVVITTETPSGAGERDAGV